MLFAVLTHCLLYIILLQVHIHSPPYDEYVKQNGVFGWSFFIICTW